MREWGEVRCTRTALFGNLLRRDAIWQQNGPEYVRRRLRAFGVCVRKHVMNRVPNHRSHRIPPGLTFRARLLHNERKVTVPRRVALERSRPQLSGNASFGVGILFEYGVVEL